jgi:hypothetical protein
MADATFHKENDMPDEIVKRLSPPPGGWLPRVEVTERALEPLWQDSGPRQLLPLPAVAMAQPPVVVKSK